jgi:hypothetical protein
MGQVSHGLPALAAEVRLPVRWLSGRSPLMTSEFCGATSATRVNLTALVRSVGVSAPGSGFPAAGRSPRCRDSLSCDERVHFS